MIYTAQQGHRYRASISVGWPKKAFVTVAVIQEKLEVAGFSEVEVWSVGAGKWMARASWTGEDCTADLPSEIDSVDDLGPI